MLRTRWRKGKEVLLLQEGKTMQAVRRSINSELCKDCPIMKRCKECYDCNNCSAWRINNFLGVIGYAKPNECFCLSKCEVNDRNKTGCALKEVAIFQGYYDFYKGVKDNG